MHLVLNGQKREIPRDCATVEELVHLFFAGFSGVVEHNGALLAREEWGRRLLQEGDVLEVVEIVGGG